jgi:hypothetical protein
MLERCQTCLARITGLSFFKSLISIGLLWAFLTLEISFITPSLHLIVGSQVYWVFYVFRRMKIGNSEGKMLTDISSGILQLAINNLSSITFAFSLFLIPPTLGNHWEVNHLLFNCLVFSTVLMKMSFLFYLQ